MKCEPLGLGHDDHALITAERNRAVSAADGKAGSGDAKGDTGRVRIIPVSNLIDSIDREGQGTRPWKGSGREGSDLSPFSRHRVTPTADPVPWQHLQNHPDHPTGPISLIPGEPQADRVQGEQVPLEDRDGQDLVPTDEAPAPGGAEQAGEPEVHSNGRFRLRSGRATYKGISSIELSQSCRSVVLATISRSMTSCPMLARS